MKIAELLSGRGRQWRGNPPASEAEILSLANSSRAELPVEYLDLLRFSNGGEGPLALAPMWLQLYSAGQCIELCHRGLVLDAFPDFMFFGSNGGMESIAFDLRGGSPFPIVAIDQIAGVSSTQQIALDMSEFIQAIGHEYDELV